MSQCVKCECSSVSKTFLNDFFKPLERAAWPALEAFLRERPHTLSGYTLGCLAAWNNTFDYKWAFPEPETLLLSFALPGRSERFMLQPIGRFSSDAERLVLRAAAELPYPVQMMGVDQPFIRAHPEFVSHFEVEITRDYHNYIYLASDLATLSGRRYSKKRNLIAQANKAYAESVEPLTSLNCHACLDILRDIREEQEGVLGQNLELDELAVKTSVRLFGDLGFQGILVRIDGRPAAFSIFEAQTPDTAVVHFERALRCYKGLYQVMNKASAEVMLERGFTFINREEDLGDPGLRQSKESYAPVSMAEAMTLTFKG